MNHRKPSRQRREDVEWTTINWADWLNNGRPLEPIGNIPSAETEAAYYSPITEHAKAA